MIRVAGRGEHVPETAYPYAPAQPIHERLENVTSRWLRFCIRHHVA
jgi:hypothetical protein